MRMSFFIKIGVGVGGANAPVGLNLSSRICSVAVSIYWFPVTPQF